MPKAAKKAHDVVVVGAGPAGIFCVLKLLASGIHDIVMIDMGKDIGGRKRRGKDLLCGWGGAGAFSDGKITLSPEVGGFLGEYLDRETLRRLLEEADRTYLEFGAPTEVYGAPSDELDNLRTEARQAGIELVPNQVRHLGTENCFHLLSRMRKELDGKVEVLTETRAETVSMENGHVRGIITADGKEVRARAVVCAPGRTGAGWMRGEANKLGLESRPNPVDIGVRVETQASIVLKLTETCYEAKLVAYSKTFEDKIRTFCMNPYGEVVIEELDGLVTVNGHSYAGKKTDNTNFALLVSSSFTRPFDDPIRYGRDIAGLANMLGHGVIVQRLGDLRHGRRSNPERLARSTTRPTLESAVPGDLSFVLPYRLLKSIMEMLEAMDSLTPGIYSRDTLLYGVEVKFYSNRIALSPHLETQIPNLFAIGDGAGITRGLLQASASGLRAGEAIAARFKG
ncbi:MAG: FAD-dependent oxidoreductase [Deltaproteobacteria bacterium]